jgi:hypothetical protein
MDFSDKPVGFQTGRRHPVSLEVCSKTISADFAMRNFVYSGTFGVGRLTKIEGLLSDIPYNSDSLVPTGMVICHFCGLRCRFYSIQLGCANCNRDVYRSAALKSFRFFSKGTNGVSIGLARKAIEDYSSTDSSQCKDFHRRLSKDDRSIVDADFFVKGVVRLPVQDDPSYVKYGSVFSSCSEYLAGSKDPVRMHVSFLGRPSNVNVFARGVYACVPSIGIFGRISDEELPSFLEWLSEQSKMTFFSDLHAPANLLDGTYSLRGDDFVMFSEPVSRHDLSPPVNAPFVGDNGHGAITHESPSDPSVILSDGDSYPLNEACFDNSGLVSNSTETLLRLSALFRVKFHVSPSGHTPEEFLEFARETFSGMPPSSFFPVEDSSEQFGGFYSFFSSQVPLPHRYRGCISVRRSHLYSSGDVLRTMVAPFIGDDHLVLPLTPSIFKAMNTLVIGPFSGDSKWHMTPRIPKDLVLRRENGLSPRQAVFISSFFPFGDHRSDVVPSFVPCSPWSPGHEGDFCSFTKHCRYTNLSYEGAFQFNSMSPPETCSRYIGVPCYDGENGAYEFGAPLVISVDDCYVGYFGYVPFDYEHSGSFGAPYEIEGNLYRLVRTKNTSPVAALMVKDVFLELAFTRVKTATGLNLSYKSFVAAGLGIVDILDCLPSGIGKYNELAYKKIVKAIKASNDAPFRPPHELDPDIMSDLPFRSGKPKTSALSLGAIFPNGGNSPLYVGQPATTFGDFVVDLPNGSFSRNRHNNFSLYGATPGKIGLPYNFVKVIKGNDYFHPSDRWNLGTCPPDGFHPRMLCFDSLLPLRTLLLDNGNVVSFHFSPSNQYDDSQEDFDHLSQYPITVDSSDGNFSKRVTFNYCDCVFLYDVVKGFFNSRPDNSEGESDTDLNMYPGGYDDMRGSHSEVGSNSQSPEFRDDGTSSVHGNVPSSDIFDGAHSSSAPFGSADGGKSDSDLDHGELDAVLESMESDPPKFMVVTSVGFVDDGIPLRFVSSAGSLVAVDADFNIDQVRLSTYGFGKPNFNFDFFFRLH